MSNKLIAIASLSLLTLSGCAQPEYLSSDFGNAVRQNMAVQVVNPTPPVSSKAPEMEGSRAAAAHDRYEAVPPKELAPEITTKK